MKTHVQQTTHAAKSVFTGLVVGGVVGAATALLFAPRPGQELRSDIRDKAIDLRDRTTETVKDTVSQAKSRAYELKENVVDKAGELKQRGQATLNKQLEGVAHTAETTKHRVDEY